MKHLAYEKMRDNEHTHKNEMADNAFTDTKRKNTTTWWLLRNYKGTDKWECNAMIQSFENENGELTKTGEVEEYKNFFYT